jgi:hypothetical protein
MEGIVLKNTEADTRPCSPLCQQPLKVSKEVTFEVRIGRPNQAFNALRYLLTKVFVRKEVWTEKEEVLFYSCVDYLQSLRSKSNWILRQNVKWLALLRTTELFLALRGKEVPTWAEKQLSILLPQILFTPRAYLGLVKKRFVDDHFRSNNRRLRRPPPPQRYIGVGYRDKGATTEPSTDGSPSWKTVAATSLSTALKWQIKQEELRRVPLLNVHRFKEVSRPGP